MDFREREVDFQEADRRYAELKRQLDIGTISTEEFDAQRRRLMVQDEEGRWWAKTRNTGVWYYHDGNGWTRGIPPGYGSSGTLPEDESTPKHRSQVEQGERLPTSQATPPDSVHVQDQNRREQHQGVSRWVIRAAGFVGTVVVGLVGMVTFRRRGIDALEQNPTADSAAQQNMGMATAAVQDPVPSDQVEAPPEPPVTTPVGEEDGSPPLMLGTPPPDAADMQPPPEAPPIAEPVGGGVPSPTEAPLVTPPPDTTRAPPPTEQPIDEPATTEPGVPTLNPELLDPTAPGATLDTGLVERIEQNPELVEAVNQSLYIARALARDPTSIDQIEQDLGLAGQRTVEPSGATGIGAAPGPGVTDPSVTEPDVPGQDLDDPLDL